jgi:hypothetical protein
MFELSMHCARPRLIEIIKCLHRVGSRARLRITTQLIKSDDLLLNIFVARKDAAKLSQMKHSGICCMAEKRRLRTVCARLAAIGGRSKNLRDKFIDAVALLRQRRQIDLR